MRNALADEAVAGIRSAQTVFVHGGAAAPSLLLSALATRGRALRDVTVVHLHCEGPAPHLAPELAGHLRHRALFIGANAREAIREGRAEYIPVFLSDIPQLFAHREIPIDVALINVSPPDRHGFCSLGTSVDVAVAAVRSASLVIAQINSAMPRTLGDGLVHSDDIDIAVACDVPPYAAAPAVLDDVERRIGVHVAELVPDGATVQMGIGAIPSAVAAALGGHRELGIHTEMFTDGVVDLVEKGAVTGGRKEVDRGRIVAAFLIGSERLYRFIDDNPMVEMRTADYTNDPGVIRRFRRMVAINSAIEVDLTGQVCADSIGTRLYSGVGGQVDFLRGAALAERGRAIIALPATALGGTRSRIVATLQPGAGVVTTRAHVHTVVTEYGVAHLHGRGTSERARSLIALAAPQFRDELAAYARRVHCI
jgi:4-hydroxybutyrate CoA-transferase